jgi:hypothetical protein
MKIAPGLGPRHAIFAQWGGRVKPGESISRVPSVPSSRRDLPPKNPTTVAWPIFHPFRSAARVTRITPQL